MFGPDGKPIKKNTQMPDLAYTIAVVHGEEATLPIVCVGGIGADQMELLATAIAERVAKRLGMDMSDFAKA